MPDPYLQLLEQKIPLLVSSHTKARLGPVYFSTSENSHESSTFFQQTSWGQIHWKMFTSTHNLTQMPLMFWGYLSKYIKGAYLPKPAPFTYKIEVRNRQMFLPCAFWRTVPLSPIFEPIRHLRRSKPSSFWQFSFFPRTGIGVMIIPLSQNLSWLFLKTAMEIGAFLV